MIVTNTIHEINKLIFIYFLQTVPTRIETNMSADFRQLLKDIRESVSVSGGNTVSQKTVQGGGCSDRASKVAHALILCLFMYLYYMKEGYVSEATLSAANALTILKENGYAAATRIWTVITSQTYEFHVVDIGAIPLAYGAIKTLAEGHKQYFKYHKYICSILTAAEDAVEYAGNYCAII